MNSYVDHLRHEALTLTRRDGKKRTVRAWLVGNRWIYVMCIKGSEFEQAILKARQS